jgi:rubrerythrin
MSRPDDIVQVDAMTRSAFVLRGALAAGAAYGSAAIGPFVREALAQGSGDVEVLSFALTLEQLEVALYEKAAELPLSSEVAALVREFGAQEAQHAASLRAAIGQLGGRPGASPAFTLPMSDEKSFLALAQSVEDTGVYAYNGAALAIRSPELLGAAAAIAQVEARHAAALRLARGLAPAPRSFDKTLTERQVRDAVRPLLER